MIDIMQAIHDPHLFKPLFLDFEDLGLLGCVPPGPLAPPMAPQELTLYQQCTGRKKAPQTPFRQAWCPGVRSGKSFWRLWWPCSWPVFEPTGAPGGGGTAYILVIAADRNGKHFRPQFPENWSRHGGSNPGPADYESAALPLSYAGGKVGQA